MKGALAYIPSAFNGDLGNSVKQNFYKQFGKEPYWMTCYSFDAVLLLAHAIDYLIKEGLNYEDNMNLNEALRTIKMIGCQGKVHIEKNSNDPSLKMYDIINVRNDNFNST